MPFFSTSHAHTCYVDGKHTMEEMIAYAKQFGFVSLGLSEHAPQGFDPVYCMDPKVLPEYLRRLRAYQKTEKEIRLWCGLEIDALVPEADFESYRKTRELMMSQYADRRHWTQMSLRNIAAAGYFAADRSIEEYAQRIWHLEKVDVTRKQDKKQ